MMRTEQHCEHCCSCDKPVLDYSYGATNTLCEECAEAILCPTLLKPSNEEFVCPEDMFYAVMAG